MKAKTFFLFFFCLLISPVISNGQVGNLLKNKLNKVVNAGVRTVDKEVSNKVDTAVQKGVVNAQENAGTRENSGQPEQGSDGAALGRLFSNKVDLKYKEDYNFSSRMYMVMESYDKKDVMKMDMYMYYSASSPSLGVETKTLTDTEGESVPVVAVMVVDGENKCFLMLSDMNGMKMGMISAVPDENSPPVQPDGKKAKADNPPAFSKTGKTREIAGFKCDEYSYRDVDDNSRGKVWFTKDAKLKIDKKGWQNTGMAAYYGNPEFNEGIILASEAYDEKGNLTMKSETKEINENYPHSISVKGYSLRQMNMSQGK